MDMRRLLPAALVFAALGNSAMHSAAQSASATTGPATVAEQYLFAQANAEREQRGLPLLRWDTALYRAADFHARQMAARASISHRYPGEPDLAERGHSAGARFSTIAENVAEAPTAVRIHDAWMQSKGHRENLLDERVNAVAIRVLRRDGELYAVQDFSREVDNLSIADQESTVSSLLASIANLTILPATDDTRRTCMMDTGYAGIRRPYFVMRYTTADLTRLPEELKTRLLSGRYAQAQIGACATAEEEAFSSYKVAVLLYP